MRGLELLEKMEYIDDQHITQTRVSKPIKRKIALWQKSALVSISGVLIFGLMFGISVLWNKEPQHYLHVDWETHYNTIEEMVMASDYIVIAQVSGQSTELRSDMVFTLSTLNVTRIIKTPSSETTNLTVLQTGGIHQGTETYPIEDVLMLQKSKTYLLFLDFTDEGLCILMGGYQGSASIINNKIIFPENHAFDSNELNNLQTNQAVEKILGLMN
jgi:hypothetical protein